MNDGIIVLAILTSVIVLCCLYQEYTREGFAIPGVQRMIGRHIRNQTRPLRRNLVRHRKNLGEQFGTMFKKVRKKKV